jgi:two-component system chemotaxis response regulator CheB
VGSWIRVLVVDDSALVRRLLSEVLRSDPGIEVVGTAPDAYVARERIEALDPHVLTLDFEMPGMDGLSFLRGLMRERPLPVVMVSVLTADGAETTLAALELGAVDFVTKPRRDPAHGLERYREEICAKVRIASRARPRPLVPRAPGRTVTPRPGAVLERARPRGSLETPHRIVAIGASTGGTEALREVLETMPVSSPGTMIVQHIPVAFSASFARRMNEISPMAVHEASDGQQVLPGHAYIAPGDRHLLLERGAAHYYCRLDPGPPVNRHRPSVDVLFRSVARNAGSDAVGVILTGMGDDGARGLLEMREAGAATLAQDKAPSVVWGMPGAAVALGATAETAPLETVASRIAALLRRARHSR